jgi:hypothetical protein
MKAFADLADLPENDRIAIIGKTAESGQIVGFFVDDEPKADRYIAKLLKRFKVKVIERGRWSPVKNAVLVKIGPSVVN